MFYRFFFFCFLLIFSEGHSAPQDPGPVLVELFTSEGCSSCPPADRFLASWGRKGFQSGNLMPLAYHVDYWDRLGWKDPFSASQFTHRQRRYQTAFETRSIYTPQMVIAGQSEFVGSDSRKAKAAVHRYQNKPSAIQVFLQLEKGKGDHQLSYQVHVHKAYAGPVELQMAVFENDLESQILRGENRGKTLRHGFVVRRLTRLEVLDGRHSEPINRTVPLPVDQYWNLQKTGLAVFAQTPADMQVLGAAVLYPLLKP